MQVEENSRAGPYPGPADEAVHRNERRFRALIENSSDGILLLDRQGRILYVAHPILGYGSDNLVGRPAGELIHPQDLENARARLAPLLADPSHVAIAEYRVRHSDGSWRWVEAVSKNLLADPDVQAVVVNYRDITERKRRDEELARAKAQIADILDSITESFMALDRECRFIYVNRKILYAAGKPREEIIGRTPWEVFPEMAGSEFEAQCRRVMQERAPVQFQAHSPAKGIWYEVHAYPTEEGLSAYILDITQRKQIEEELQRSHEQLVSVLESLSEGFIALDRNWRFTYVNQHFAEHVRRPAEQVLGRQIWELFPAGEKSESAAALRRAMEQRIHVRSESYIEESHRWFEQDAYPTREGLAVFTRDITARKQAESALSLMAEIVASSADAIISKDLDGTILTWNAAAERVYGYSAEEAIGRNMSMLLESGREGEELEILDRLRRGERVDHFETARVRKDGKRIFVSFTVSPIRDTSGRVTGASHIARDITDRKQIEEQLLQTQKLESLGVLAGGVAHDFNNLLTGILGNASLALDMAPPEDPTREMLADVVNASERAAHLTRQLLAYAGKGKFLTQRIDVAEMTRELSSLLRTSIPKHVSLELDLAESAVTDADPGQLQQVLMNLVINAAEAVPEGKDGRVAVRTRVEAIDDPQGWTAPEPLSPGTYVRLEVEDNGCGMDEATCARIFDPFFTTKFIGRGLGLSAVLGIIRGHKGALKVTSRPGEGTLFRVLLPAAAAEVAEPEWPAAARGDLKGRGVVLVADDEPSVRQAARHMLERYGYDVLLASNGRDAVETFRREAQRIALVLLDLTMPLMNGEETLSRIQDIRPEARVLLSSGYDESEAVGRFDGRGLAGFIQKPYTAAQLAAKVQQVLQEK